MPSNTTTASLWQIYTWPSYAPTAQYVDEFLKFLQSAFNAGIDVDLAELDGIFWVAAAIVIAIIIYKLIKLVVSLFVDSVEFVVSLVVDTLGLAVSLMANSLGIVKKMVDKGFWRETDLLTPLISFVLLVLAYAFYPDAQTRTLTQALIHLGSEQLALVMPLAIATQWGLLSGFWVLLGLIMGVPFGRLLQPAWVLAYMALLTLQMIMFTRSVSAFFAGDFTSAHLGAVALTAPTVYLGCVLDRPQRQRPADQPAPDPSVKWMPEEVGPPGSRWLVPPGDVLGGSIGLMILYLILIGVIFVAHVVAGLGTPSVEQVVQGELVVISVLFLVMCAMFRGVMLAGAAAPPALLHFIDLSLALSACAIAMGGVVKSAVTLGPVPTWLVTVAPSLVVALLIFAVHLPRLRESTPRWGICLATSVAASVLVWPARLALTPWIERFFGGVWPW